MAGGQAIPAAAPPVVLFRPAGHAPIPLTVRSWSEHSVVATSSATVYHGPGWVHLIADGVPSEGRFSMLPAASNGAACTVDSQCATGHCIDRLCCDTTCEGPCFTCVAAHQAPGGSDGFCGRVVAGSDPRDACETAPVDSCGHTGACSGEGACALYANGTVCRLSGRCEAGTCLRCNAEGNAVIAGESTVSCLPFACRQGSCLATCTSQSDCADGHFCALEGRCKVFRAAAPVVDPGACATSAPGRGSGDPRSLAVLVAMAVVMSRLRRARGGNPLNEDLERA